MSSDQRDHLHYGTMTMSSSDIPRLTSGDDILKKLEHQISTKENISGVMKAPKEVMRLCEKVFPEVVECNQIGKQDPSGPSPNNVIIIEEDTGQYGGESTNEKRVDVYVGGPPVLSAAAIQSKSEDSEMVLYAHDGQRGYSNWKGSCSYFHIRETFPVYYWPDNHGLYLAFITLKHAIERRLDARGYLEKVKYDPNWNKLRLSYKGILRDLPVLGLFAENQWNALKDVGLHLRGTRLSSAEDTSAYITTHHAHLTNSIIQHLASDRESSSSLLMKSTDRTRSLHVELGKAKSSDPLEINHTYKSVSEDAGGPWLENVPLNEENLHERGYNTDFVKQAFEFPRDGYFPPSVGEALESMIIEGGGEIRSQLRLKKVLYRKTSDDEARASRVVWEKIDTRESLTTKVNSVYISLGPTANVQWVDSDKNGVLTSLFPTLASVDILKQRMKAAGSSIIFLVKIDKSVVDEKPLMKFRDHIGSHNKHFIRLGEKEVVIDGKPFQFFLQQTTGGGQFPLDEAHPETTLNVFNANVIPLFGLDGPGFEYDIITVRTCARSVTAGNTFQFFAPLSNMVGVYGMGGIGMTTMFPNGLLMKALMKLRGELAKGDMTNMEFENRLATSDFGSIPHWSGPNPFARNYTRFVDHYRCPSILARNGSIFKRLVPCYGSIVQRVVPGHGSILRRMVRFLR